MSKDTSLFGNEKTMDRYNSSKIIPYLKRCNAAKFPDEYLDKIIKQIPENGKFLDAGCGVGQFLRQLILRSKEVSRDDVEFYAFDFSHVMLSGIGDEKGALHNLNGLGVKVWQADLKDLDSILKGGSKKFDYVISRDVVFFFNNEEKKVVLNNLKEICADDGVLCLELREKRFDKDQSKGFNDGSEFDWRSLLQDSGFKVKKSIIGGEISYGTPGQDNLNRFYKRLIIASSPETKLKAENPSAEPSLADDFSRKRHEVLQNKAKNEKGEIVL